MFFYACWNSSSRWSRTWWKVPAELWEWGVCCCCGKTSASSCLEHPPRWWRPSGFSCQVTDTLQPDCFISDWGCLRGASWGDAALLPRKRHYMSSVFPFYNRRMQIEQCGACSSVAAAEMSLVIFWSKTAHVELFSSDMGRHCQPQEESGKTHQLWQKDVKAVCFGFCFVRKKTGGSSHSSLWRLPWFWLSFKFFCGKFNHGTWREPGVQ